MIGVKGLVAAVASAVVLAGIFCDVRAQSNQTAQNAPPGAYGLLPLRAGRARRPAKKPPTPAQTSISLRDQQAVTLANQALSALVGTTTITDATVQGTASFIAGSDQESGTATLEARLGYESHMALALSGGPQTEVRNFSAAPPQGKWAGPDGTWHATPMHNCWTDPAWFFPALTIQSALNDSQISFAYIGQDTKNGVAVQHIQITRLIPGQIASATDLIKKLSQMDLYLDATSNLPIAIDFNTHPTNDAGRDLPVEIQFSGWRAAGSIQAPTRIQKFLQGSLILDLTVSGVTLNTGIPQSEFVL